MILASVVLTLHALANVWMTAYVWRATHLERATRWRQTLLIWLVPVFGLLVMYAIRGSINATWKGYRGSGSDDHFCGPQGQR